mmetsp:Transcript_40304/g.66180  ORF Transcript_40304/g.66180 Transcript_40304/m.66180 type:complete len:211 (+) Transcript_40304:455-1087(+)
MLELLVGLKHSVRVQQEAVARPKHHRQLLIETRIQHWVDILLVLERALNNVLLKVLDRLERLLMQTHRQRALQQVQTRLKHRVERLRRVHFECVVGCLVVDHVTKTATDSVAQFLKLSAASQRHAKQNALVHHHLVHVIEFAIVAQNHKHGLKRVPLVLERFRLILFFAINAVGEFAHFLLAHANHGIDQVSHHLLQRLRMILLHQRAIV